jgi:CRP-like cAMP-binding protein
VPKAEGGIRERCGRGYLIGETPLFVEAKRPAFALATNGATVLEIGRQAMKDLLTEHPASAEVFFRKISDRVTGTIDELQKVRETLLAIGG